MSSDSSCQSIKNKDDWGTPDYLYDELNNEFKFTLDPCPFPKPEWDGLELDWTNERVFVNPPYSGSNIENWMKKCFNERNKAEVIVMLIPTTKTGTKYFKKYVLDIHAETRFITGRVNFVPLAGQNENSNPLYSMLVIWRRVDES